MWRRYGGNDGQDEGDDVKRWKIGFILGILYVIAEIFYHGWGTEYIRYLYLTSFDFRAFIATAFAVLFSLPQIFIIGFGLPQWVIRGFMAIIVAIGGLIFYLVIPLSTAFIGYLIDLQSSINGWRTEIANLKSRKNLKKGLSYFVVMTLLFSIILYLPEPEMVRPKEKMKTISSTPVFQFRMNPRISYPHTFITTSTRYVDSEERISAGGGHFPAFGRGMFITITYPLRDSMMIDVSVTEYKYFHKYVDFGVREFHYYFTVNMSQHPSPEEMEVIDYLIDSEIPGYGSYLNPPSDEELETINKLKTLGVPPHGTRLKDVNWTNFKSPGTIIGGV